MLGKLKKIIPKKFLENFEQLLKQYIMFKRNFKQIFKKFWMSFGKILIQVLRDFENFVKKRLFIRHSSCRYLYIIF